LRKLLISAAIAASSLGVLAAAAPAAMANSAHGYATCGDPGLVEGVWVSTGGGQSGWATMNVAGNKAKTVSFSRPVSGQVFYSITVGCGGSPQRWAITENGVGSATDWPTGWRWNCSFGMCQATSAYIG